METRKDAVMEYSYQSILFFPSIALAVDGATSQANDLKTSSDYLKGVVVNLPRFDAHSLKGAVYPQERSNDKKNKTSI